MIDVSGWRKRQIMAEDDDNIQDYKKPWVGLTRMELIKCGVLPWGMSYKLYEAIEAKLKEKNI